MILNLRIVRVDSEYCDYLRKFDKVAFCFVNMNIKFALNYCNIKTNIV